MFVSLRGTKYLSMDSESKILQIVEIENAKPAELDDHKIRDCELRIIHKKF